MRVVFFGTPSFAVPSFEALSQAGVEVVAAVSQPDRPRGRSHSTLLPCPVKAAAMASGVPVFTPDNPRDPDFMAALALLAPDLGVVVAYGHLLRPALLAIPHLGLVNVHASLLPRWRGAAPIHWAIRSGDRKTGVSIMRVEAGLDSGAVWHQQSIAIGAGDTTGMLFERLATLGAEALIEALPRIAAGEQPVPQDESRATHAPKIDRAMARIDWTMPVAEVSAQIRAMDPAPGAWTTVAGRDVKLFHTNRERSKVKGEPADDTVSPFTFHDLHHPPPPGTIQPHDGLLLTACSDGWLPLGEITPAGGKRMAALTWYHGAQLTAGAAFQ